MSRNKENSVYVVNALRWGQRGNHSYLVGVYSKKHAANQAAEAEENYRGGKYGCEVVEIPMDSGISGGEQDRSKVVRSPKQ